MDITSALLRQHYPLTFAERQMATEQYMNPESCAYNMNIAMEITGSLNVNRLERALCVLVKRYAAFRSFYPMEGGDFVHKVADELAVSLHIEDCTADEVPMRISKANAPYDISRAPYIYS